MNISYKWLRQYVDFDLTPQEVSDALTSIGLEVGALEEVKSIRGAALRICFPVIIVIPQIVKTNCLVGKLHFYNVPKW